MPHHKASTTRNKSRQYYITKHQLVKIYFPPPLDVTRRTQRSQNSGEQQSISRASSSWWFISSCSLNPQDPQKTTVYTTIMKWFRRTCKESKITLYYWLHTMIIMQSTGLLNIRFTFSLKTLLFFWPWKPAKQMRWNNPPEKYASKICHENLPDLYATKTRQIYTQEKHATLTRSFACQRTPLPRSESPGKTRPATPSPPPPGNSVNGEGAGGGREPARLAHASWTGTFTFIPFSWMVTYSYMTQHIHILHRAD